MFPSMLAAEMLPTISWAANLLLAHVDTILLYAVVATLFDLVLC